ncbi:MAG: DUF805 domain-containing protein [Acidimicrobiales bacterium]
MNFPNAVVTCLRKYVTFSGVASRSEFWWFFLFEGIGYGILRAINVPTLVSFWSLALFLPALAVNVRRLHDTGRSGWWYFAWILVPWEVILLCLPTTTSDNRYVTGTLPSITEENVSSSALKCPSCAKLRLPGQNYCMGCGAPFNKE